MQQCILATFDEIRIIHSKKFFFIFFFYNFEKVKLLRLSLNKIPPTPDPHSGKKNKQLKQWEINGYILLDFI